MLSANSLRAILVSQGDGWRECCLSNGSTCSFLPVLEHHSMVSGRHAYGMLRSGDWVAEYADGARVMPVGHFVAFFVLLELTHREVVDAVKQGVQRASLPPVVSTTFPFDQILVAALGGGGHWRVLAEAWLDSGYPIDGTIADAAPEHPSVRRWAEDRRDRIYFLDALQSGEG